MDIQMGQKRHRTLHAGPKEVPATAPKDIAALAFAQRLQHQMNEKGWNQSDLSRAASLHMENGEVSRDSISKYINAAFLPTPPKLAAIAKALGVDTTDLVETRGVGTVAEKNSGTSVRDLGDGMTWLRINQAVSWATALKVLELLKGDANE